MRYRKFLNELKSLADESYRAFHMKLLKNDKIRVLGVRVPQLRALAKKYRDRADELLSFPDDYYEVTFVKLAAASLLDYDCLIERIDRCVPLIDNWATCDCFSPKCIAKHRDEFLPYLYDYIARDGEFYQRFVLTTLLHFYVDETYYETVLDLVRKADVQKYYYVHMAAAWLLAELLIRFYDKTEKWFEADGASCESGAIHRQTHNKAIQKACESFRLSDEKKNYLKGLKR